MALTVCGRLREELGLDIDSSEFVRHPTIGAFAVFLRQFEKEPAPAPPPPQMAPAAASSQASSSVAGGSSGDAASSVQSDATTDATSAPSTGGGGGGGAKDARTEELREILRTTIAEAMGVEVDEIVAAPNLSQLGMDSLMSLTILGSLREHMNIDLPPDLLNDYLSLAAIERELGLDEAAAAQVLHPTVPAPAVPAAAAVAPPTSHSYASPGRGASAVPATKEINTHPGNTTASYVKPPRPTHVPDDYPKCVARSVMLQGVSAATRTLWMVPDGSGSATSYTEIGKMAPDWAVRGLWSPYLKEPEKYKCGVYGMATKFVAEMVRVQPEGPYSLAGWSAGGVIAFEMAQQLSRAGKVVDHLIFIDAPCPVTIEPLPRSLHEWFASIGLLGDGDDDGLRPAAAAAPARKQKVPEWLLPHFAASVAALSTYHADPIPREIGPRVIMTIWCEDGVCKLPSDARPDPYPTGHALFLLENRVDFGPNRWDEYLAEDRFVCRHMPGNHFSMMMGELGLKLGDFLRVAIMM
jgi:thioesterase domain-containing protein/acyl carrier protein